MPAPFQPTRKPPARETSTSYDLVISLDRLIQAARGAGLGDDHPIVRQALDARAEAAGVAEDRREANRR